MIKKLGRKGKLTVQSMTTAMIAIVLVVVVFLVYAGVMPEATAAGDSMNNSATCADVGCWYNSTSDYCQYNSTHSDNESFACSRPTAIIPLSSLFGGTGLVFVLVMAALFILVIRSFLKGKK